MEENDQNQVSPSPTKKITKQNLKSDVPKTLFFEKN